jgi:hypothetical protein
MKQSLSLFFYATPESAPSIATINTPTKNIKLAKLYQLANIFISNWGS